MLRRQKTRTRDTSGIGVESVEDPAKRRWMAGGDSEIGPSAGDDANSKTELIGGLRNGLTCCGDAMDRGGFGRQVPGATGSSPTANPKRRRTSNVWLSPRQFAQQFGVGTSAVYGAVERGEVPAIRVGRHIRIPPDTVETILRVVIKEDK